uniref:Uncharacterized protein n=1 Tax=Cucumis melo TaxID=3656 RepID=A0A9I9EJ26_CUCME
MGMLLFGMIDEIDPFPSKKYTPNCSIFYTKRVPFAMYGTPLVVDLYYSEEISRTMRLTIWIDLMNHLHDFHPSNYNDKWI